MKTNTLFEKTISLVLFFAITISSLFALSSCSATIGGTATPLPPEELLSVVLEETEKEFDTVADYLDFWELPEFSKSKIEALERLYRSKFVEEIPTPKDKAKDVALYFIEYFYDGKIQDVDETTDMLIYSFVETTNDKYSIYRTKEEYEEYDTNMNGSFVGIGVTVRYSTQTNDILVESVNEDSGAEEAGILPGDYIIKVDGESVDTLGYQKAIANVKGKAGTSVNITVLRGEQELTFTVIRKKIVEKSVTYEMKNGIAYIKISSFKANTAGQFKDALDEAVKAGAEGVIYDLRDNLGGYLDTVLEMLDYIAPKGTQLASFTNDYMDPVYSKSSHMVSLPSVVICNGSTASAGELFTAGIRDFSDMKFFPASLVGEKTYGKGIMQNTYLFNDNSSITMTVAYYNPPSGINYHDKGIIPNVIVEDGEGDPQLKVAYEEITRLIKANK